MDGYFLLLQLVTNKKNNFMKYSSLFPIFQTLKGRSKLQVVTIKMLTTSYKKIRNENKSWIFHSFAT